MPSDAMLKGLEDVLKMSLGGSGSTVAEAYSDSKANVLLQPDHPFWALPESERLKVYRAVIVAYTMRG